MTEMLKDERGATEIISHYNPERAGDTVEQGV